MPNWGGGAGGAASGAAMGSAFGPIGTGIGAAIGGLAGLFGGGGGDEKKKAEEDQRRLLNEFLEADAASKQKILGALGGGDPEAGLQALLGGRSMATNFSNMMGASNTRQAVNMLTSPEWARENKPVLDSMRSAVQSAYAESDTGAIAEELARQSRNINAQARAAQAAQPLNTRLGGVGVTGAPGGGNPGVEAARVAALLNTAGSADALRTQRQDRANQLANQFASLTRGQRQKGTTVTKRNYSQTGSGGRTSFDPLRNVMAARSLTAPTAPGVSMQTGMTPGADAFGAFLEGAPALFDTFRQNKAGWGGGGNTVQQLPAARNYTSSVFRG